MSACVKHGTGTILEPYEALYTSTPRTHNVRSELRRNETLIGECGFDGGIAAARKGLDVIHSYGGNYGRAGGKTIVAVPVWDYCLCQGISGSL